MIRRKKATRIWTIISVCSLGLYTTACDSGEIPVKEDNAANIELRFTASISDNPSVKTAYGATFTKANAHGPAILQGTAFGDGTHTFGMWITDETGGALVTGSNDNMKAIFEKSGSANTWTYTDKSGSPLSLQAKHGENIKITGYYPWTADATANGNAVPFDFSNELLSANWKDLLYLSSPAYDATSQVTDGSSIALTFSHAYCWVTIKLSKLTADPAVAVSAVSIENGGTGGWIKNKGNINPKTGNVSGATSGLLKIVCPEGHPDLPLEGSPGNPAFEYNFLVPPFMDTDVQDSDILIRVFTNDNKVLSFPLQRAHLNNMAPDLYGLKQGMHNTYNIVYNNSSMILSVSDWQEVAINDRTLGGGPTGGTVTEDVIGDYTSPFPDANKLTKGNHLLHTYLGEVAENNNGKYLTLEITTEPANLFEGWRPFLAQEPFYPVVLVAKNLAAGGAPVPWKDEKTGVLTAKQACAEFRDGGYTDWRLPRVSELYIFAYQTPDALRPESEQLWSGTECDADNCYSTKKYPEYANWTYPQKSSKKTSLYVRCVRDYDKPKSAM